MRFKDFCGLAEWELIRDAEVHTLGFIETPVDGRLVFATDETNLRRAAAAGGVTAIITTPEVAHAADKTGITLRTGLALAADPKLSFAALHNHLAAGQFYGVPAPSEVHASAQIHPTAHVDPTGIVIGAGCRIGPKAVILSGTILHEDVQVMAGAVLGSSGFQVMRGEEVLDLAHVGRLRVGARTTIMANAVLARAVFQIETSLGADCRVGNNAFISHNCRIGERCLIGHGAVVAGGCVIEEDVVLGPGVICIDRRRIGPGAIITAGATVARDVPAGARLSGPFARTHLGGFRDA